MISKVCENKNCQLPFLVATKHKTKRFCSRDCYKIGIKKDDIKSHRRIMIDGKRVYEHRHVWEKETGEKLLDTEIIHHINGNRLDNRFENLKKLSGQAAHLHAHNYFRNRRGTWQADDEIPF